MAKKLVVFYSWSDHTRAVAAYLAEQTGADLLELRVREGEYPSNYAQCVSRAAKYGRRYEPELLNAVPDLRAYGTVFVGSPCWWGTIAQVSTREPAVSNLGDFRAQADAWLARIGPALRG